MLINVSHKFFSLVFLRVQTFFENSVLLCSFILFDAQQNTAEY